MGIDWTNIEHNSCVMCGCATSMRDDICPRCEDNLAAYEDMLPEFFDVAKFHNEIDQQINLETQEEDNDRYKYLTYDQEQGLWSIFGNGKAFDNCMSDGEAMAKFDNN